MATATGTVTADPTGHEFLDDDLLACPACIHESLERMPDQLQCASCRATFPVKRGIVDFRYLEQRHRDGDNRVDDEFEAPDPEMLVEKKGAADIQVRRQIGRIRALKRELGRIELLDVGMFMADGAGLKPFFQEIGGELDLYCGIDPSPHEIFTDGRRPGHIRILRSYGEFLPLRSNSFNYAVSIASFDHLFDADRCLSEIRRVLRPGGVFYVQLNNDGAWFKRLFKAAGDRRREAAREWHNYFWSLAQFRRLLERHGFQVTESNCYRYNPVFDNSSLAGALPPPLQSAISRVTDIVGNVVLPGFGGNFAITCRSPR